MSTMVTARIPDELYEQGKERLAALGATPSQLMRAAWDYVVQQGEIPTAQKPVSNTRRVLTEEQRRDFGAKLRATRLPLSLPPDWDYKSELSKMMAAEYEALS